MKRIIIAGAGSLGQRHLEALSLLEGPLTVDIIDPSDQALFQAEQKVSAAPRMRVSLHGTPETLNEPADMAIVATNSRERREVIEKLSGHGVGKFILEKVLFPRLVDYEAVTELFSRAGSQVWVNCARRTFPYAALLRDVFAGKSFTYRVEGGAWGLGCNLVHHLDEVAFFSGRDDFSCDISELDQDIIPAKRAGYFEVTGTFRATLPEGVEVVAISRRGEAADRSVTITSDTATAVIDEAAQTMTLTREGRSSELAYQIPYQSVITAEHVTRILEGRSPDLPDFAIASKVHKKMITALLGHFRQALSQPGLDECPIT